MQPEIIPFKNKTSTDLTDKEGYFVEYDTDGIKTTNAITDVPVGVVTRGGAIDSDVCVAGRCNVRAGGTFKRGQRIGPHTDGTAVVSAGSGCQDAGIALEDAVAGDIVPAFITPVAKTHS